MKYWLVSLLLFLQFGFCAQIVTINPTFANQNDYITVTYDATQGSRGLLDVSQVYMHAGVITDKSTSPTQWRHVVGNWGTDDNRVKMTALGNNKHQISYSIRDFHNVPANEKVLRLAFVFRNVNGTREGKTAELQDIFMDLYDENIGFESLLLSPSSQSFIARPQDVIPVRVAVSLEAEITLYQNGQMVSQTSGKDLTYDITVPSSGEYDVEYMAIREGDTLSGGFSYLITPPVQIKELPSNSQLGINRINPNTARFVLHAPQKKHVYIVGDFSDYKMSNAYLMNNTPDGKYWWIDIPNLEPSRLYTYQYLVDGDIRIADPMSEMILDSQNDKHIESSVFSDIPAFPANKTSGIVTVFRPEKEKFPWQHDNYQRPDPTNLFIYELLMRDFMEEQSYQNLTDTLDYLEKLGVTAIELMPVNEFENNDSWGYNPSFHMALDKYYGSPESFKRFVDECHRRGIAVLVDVVFNHVFGQSPLARLYWDKDKNRPAPDNPWLNTEPKHPYNVGYDVNHESQATREWMDQILRYMIEEYHIDGYRFDLTKGFTQRQSTEATASNYDASRVAILKRMADKIREYDSKSILILEHFCENREEKELAEYGFFFWGNLNYSYNEATMGYHDNNKSNFNWISHKQRGWQRPHVVGYMESHDEERLMYKNLQFGNTSGSYSVKNLSTALKRIELAVPLFLLIPGPKMIWQFGELGYDYSINTCEDRSVQPQCRLSRKPIRWDYLNDDRRRNVFDVFAQTAFLKKEYSVFKSDDFSLNVAGSFKSMLIKSPGHHIQVLGNFDTRTLTSSVTFPTSGVYYEYFTGDTLRVQSNPVQMTLNAGEYRLYSDVFMDRRTTLSSTSQADSGPTEVRIFPNPAQNHLNIDIEVLKAQNHHIELTGLDGKVVMRISDIFLTPGLNEIETDISQVPAGMYFIRIWSKDHNIVRRLSVVR